MKYNFNKPLLDLDGNPLKPDGREVNLGRTLGSTLVQQTKGDAFKFFDWAKTLQRGEPLDLDRADSKLLKETIESIETITILFKAQLLEVFDEAEKKISDHPCN